MKFKIKKLNNKKFISGIFLIGCIIATIISYCYPTNVIATMSIGTKNDEAIGPLKSGDVIEMDMPEILTTSNLCAVELNIATYKQILKNGEIYVQIIDKNNGDMLTDSTVSLQGTSDNSKKTIVFNEDIPYSDDYFLRIKILNLDDSIALWMTDTDDYTVKYNNKEYNGILNAKILYYTKDNPWTWQLIVFTLIVILMFSVIN